VNLGTPDSPHPRDVRRYLREFLTDPRVIDLPNPARALLVYGLILPFRPRRSGAAYASIWGPEGSPLLQHGRALEQEVSRALGPAFAVELGMRYGRPSLAEALDRLEARGAREVVALPLFPQYAAAATGSVRARLQELAAGRWDPPALTVLGDFHAAPAFVQAQAEIARPLLREFRPDHVLLSYHGLPERQIRRSDPEGPGVGCLARPDCCEAPGARLGRCYRAQCFATSAALREALGLPADRVSTSFQSRLGRAAWIPPYTDHVLPQLAERGVRRLAVACPSFVADCLETLEEIGIRGREQWREVGGEDLLLLPCVNAHPVWVRGVADWVRQAAAGVRLPQRAAERVVADGAREEARAAR